MSLKRTIFLFFQKQSKALWARIYLVNALLSDFHGDLRLILSVFFTEIKPLCDFIRHFCAYLRVFCPLLQVLTSYSFFPEIFSWFQLFFEDIAAKSGVFSRDICFLRLFSRFCGLIAPFCIFLPCFLFMRFVAFLVFALCLFLKKLTFFIKNSLFC